MLGEQPHCLYLWAWQPFYILRENLFPKIHMLACLTLEVNCDDMANKSSQADVLDFAIVIHRIIFLPKLVEPPLLLLLLLLFYYY